MINFAVIGTNFITDKFIDATKKIDDVKVTAVYSRTLQRANEYAAKYSINKVYTDLDKLGKDKDIDAVYIANPTAFHNQTAINLMKYKKHILCEKPMASNEEQVLQMIKCAQENDVQLLEAMRTVHNPTINIIKNNLHKLSTIRNVKLSYCQYSSRYDKFKNGILENAFKRELSNGALMDIGSYVVHIAVHLFSYPKQISSIGISLKNSIDAVGVVLLEYEDKICQLSYSKISDGKLLSEIQGENGSMLIEDIACPKKIFIEYKDGTKEVLHDEVSENDLVYEIENFKNGIVRKLDLQEYLKDSHKTIKILDKARQIQGIKFPCDKW